MRCCCIIRQHQQANIDEQEGDFCENMLYGYYLYCFLGILNAPQSLLLTQTFLHIFRQNDYYQTTTRTRTKGTRWKDSYPSWGAETSSRNWKRTGSPFEVLKHLLNCVPIRWWLIIDCAPKIGRMFSWNQSILFLNDYIFNDYYRELERIRARMEADLARRQEELNRYMSRRQNGRQRQQNHQYVRRNRTRRDSVESDSDEQQTFNCRLQWSISSIIIFHWNPIRLKNPMYLIL